MIIIPLLLASFLIGGIPSGYLITRRLKGFDIRNYGSGNPGAANVYRVVGKEAGWATFACDGLKGALVVIMALYFAKGNDYIAMACGFTAICGHMWTPFLKLRGGKGVATSAGVFGAIFPVPTIIALIVFAGVVWRTNRISPGSIAAAIVLPLAACFTDKPLIIKVIACVIGAIVVYKHIPNIKRMLQNNELKFEDGGKKNNASKVK